jgi:hypothetical protein
MGWFDYWRVGSCGRSNDYSTRMDMVHCVLANGAYIATAWFSGDRYLDTPKLLEHGASPIAIVVYCLTTIGFGYVGFRRSCESVLSAPTKLRAEIPQTVDEPSDETKSPSSD